MDESPGIAGSRQKSLIPPLDRRLHCTRCFFLHRGRGNTPAKATATGFWWMDKLIFDTWKYATALQDHATLNLSAGPHKIVAEGYRISPSADICASASSTSTKSSLPPRKALAAKVDSVIVAAGFDATVSRRDRTAPSVSPLVRKN